MTGKDFRLYLDLNVRMKLLQRVLRRKPAYPQQLSLRVKSMFTYLRMTTTIGRGLSDLLIDDDIDFDALLGFALQQPVKAPFFIIAWGPS